MVFKSGDGKETSMGVRFPYFSQSGKTWIPADCDKQYTYIIIPTVLHSKAMYINEDG